MNTFKLPLTPTVHKSELLAFIPGDIALGGGLITVVSLFAVLLKFELLVDSVTIGSAPSTAVVANSIIVEINTASIFLFIFSP